MIPFLKIFMIVIGAILALCVLILLLLFGIFRYEVLLENQDVTLRIWGITIYRNGKKPKKNDSPAVEEKEEQSKKKLTEQFKILKNVYNKEKLEIQKILSLAAELIVIDRMDFSMEFGLGDAAATGVATGAAWSVLSGAVVFIDEYLPCKKVTNLAVQPNFTKPCFRYKLRLIFHGRLIYFIKLAIRVLRFLKQNQEEIKKL